MTEPVERRELAPGYSVSRLIHGGWQFSEGHRLDGPGLSDALDVLEASAELGVTTFDCADIYTGVEELYGRLLRRWGSRAADRPLQVHTKLVPDYGDLARVDRAYVTGIVDRSLKRLGVERVDLVQFYWWRDDVPGMEEAARWLDDLRRAGKVRCVAVTNFDVDRVRRLEEAGIPVVSNQVQYSLLDRRPEHGLAEYARSRGIGLLAFGALAGGLLTDRWVARERTDRPRSRSQIKYELIVDEFGGWEAHQALLGDLSAIARRENVDTASVALRWVLDRDSVAAVICGATRPGQMARNVEAFRMRWEDGDEARLRHHLERAPGPRGPVFGLERDRDGRHGRIMRYDLNRESPESATGSSSPVPASEADSRS